MKTIVLVFFILCSLYLYSCQNNESNSVDTTTAMPDGGYEPRTSDSFATTDSASLNRDRGAVALDTVKNGQVMISGATEDSSR